MGNSKSRKADRKARTFLRSVDLLFGGIEDEILESYSLCALSVIKKLSGNARLIHFLTDRLEIICQFVPETRLNFLYALAICWAIENQPTRKEELFRKFQREFPEKTHNFHYLDFILSLEYEAPYDVAPLWGSLISRIDFPKIIELYADYRDVSPYVREWLRLTNSFSDISYKRTMLCSNKSLSCFTEKFKEHRYLLGKTLVNFLAEDSNPRFQKLYLRTLKSMSGKYSSDTEFQNIYSSGLLNCISLDSCAEDLREASFRELFRLLQTFADSSPIQENYATAIFCLALEEKKLAVKRKRIRALMNLLQKTSLSPIVFRTAAQTLFNHIIDESSIPRKRKVLRELGELTNRTGNLSVVCREYARALVNMMVDDPNVGKKNHYLKILENLTEKEPDSNELALEYAKALMNFALNSVEEIRTAEYLSQLLEFLDKRKVVRDEKTSDREIRRDFLCIYAEGLVLFLRISYDYPGKLKILKHIPPVVQIHESEYFFVFAALLKNSLAVERDPDIRTRLSELMKETSRYYDFQKENADKLEQERETRE